MKGEWVAGWLDADATGVLLVRYVAMDDDYPDEIPPGQLRRDNFLYLLHEMECALDRGGIDWTGEAANAVFDRLVTANVAGIAGRLELTEGSRPPDHRRPQRRRGSRRIYDR